MKTLIYINKQTNKQINKYKMCIYYLIIKILLI